jgi:NADPH:quinone reductase-like Zn-dependent oxidoreductase
MKAITYEKYGPSDVLLLKEVEQPTPKDNEVLIKVHAVAVTSGDARVRGMNMSPLFWLPARIMFGFTKPKKPILGGNLAGIIEEVGKDVKQFKKGEQVFGSSGLGAYAQYVCVPENGALATKPTNTTFKEAAAIPFGGLTSLYFLRDKGHIQKGQSVLIIGAAGVVGTAAVQLAKHFGARVTGVCSTAQLKAVTSLGADRVVDYTKEDFTKNGEVYDIIFDTVGVTLYSRCKGLLKPNGRYLLTVFGFRELIQMLWTSIIGGRKVICGVGTEKKEDLIFLKELVEAGNIKPVIDKSYPLEQIVDAHKRVETRHKTGSVVVDVNDNKT